MSNISRGYTPAEMPVRKGIKKISIENAQFAYKPNFEGRRTDSNPQGRRNFTIILEPEVAEQLVQDGWNVKYKPYPKGKWMEGDPLTPMLEVQVNMEDDSKYPAEVYIVSNGVKHRLYADRVHLIDDTEFEQIDMVIRPYTWNVNGKSGVKAYLHTLYACGVLDTVTSKYMDLPFAE